MLLADMVADDANRADALTDEAERAFGAALVVWLVRALAPQHLRDPMLRSCVLTMDVRDQTIAYTMLPSTEPLSPLPPDSRTLELPPVHRTSVWTH